MNKLIFMLFAFMILGCNQNNIKKDDLLGTWDAVSLTDRVTGEVELAESDFTLIVEFKLDSLYLDYDEVYAWQIEGDSIFVKRPASDNFPVFIKELTKNELLVEYDFMGEFQIKLKKRK